MNGGHNRFYPGEDDVSVPSLQGVSFEDVPQLSSAEVVKNALIGIGEIVSGVGRSLALDRNEDYQKTQTAYNAFVFGKGRHVKCM